ncbi:hypothetical protein GCM10010218_57550 [Streptomyces mashuensis]|uniref:DUF3152 domain-containing protein n=1 Tax=Streptomyces mashuensis TaxID=33904 RepID=A0A919B7W0_9ACTN|nr:DUF3152 domain-containing protein [Streptomyces mashuensis]GHF68609.1 hypothetical protein GCM10010218_57550 [Streptomyces mashuensis]
MGKHSARADRARHGPAAAAAPGGPAGRLRRRTPDGQGPAVPAVQETTAHEPAGTPVPGPGTGRRRGTASGEEAAALAAGFDAAFDAAREGGADTHAGPGEGPGHDPAGQEPARGGHPEQRDPVAGWGVIGAQRDRTAGPATTTGPAGRTRTVTGYSPGGAVPAQPAAGDGAGARPPAGAGPGAEPRPARRREPARRAAGADGGPAGTARGGRRVARTATGVAAAVVTALLAVAVAAQVDDGGDGTAQARTADSGKRPGVPDTASRSDSRPTPQGGIAAAATYEDRMARKYPLDPKVGGSGEFETVGGQDQAPGKGEILRYRVDVEKGLPLDGALFATAVHRTLNDERSWGHGGKRTFERVSSGSADFVISLASPRTTADWCAKSGLDTTEDNVSCDSAATDRVMINAYRWAQGSETYGDRMHEYRQMLINHEVGHRLKHDHEMCSADGALAPVMMQQTKFLKNPDDGRTCKPNPWPFPDAKQN